jgi:hypothetical protein
MQAAIDAARREAEAAQALVERSRRRMRIGDTIFLPAANPQVRSRVQDDAAVYDSSCIPLMSRHAATNPELIVRRLSGPPRLQRYLSIEQMPRRGKEWVWLSTVSFFVASSFIIGALLFMVGAVAAIFGSPIVSTLAGWQMDAWKESTIVNHCYFVGHCYFVIGAYLGWFEVINVGRDERRLWASPDDGLSRSGYWAALLYFLGTLPFQVATTTMVLSPSVGGAGLLWLVWLPQAVGGIFYTAAAAIEFQHNRDARCSQRVFWLCALYLTGSILFLIAASAGTVLAGCETHTWSSGCGWLNHEVVELCLVDGLYLIGSIAFCGGGWLQLQMWKSEQFGLGFIREINPLFHKNREAAPSNKGDRDGFAGGWDSQLTLAFFMLNAAVSAINLILNRGWQRYTCRLLGDCSFVKRLLSRDRLGLEELFTSLTGWVASHSMLLLATVVHYTPSLHPYDYLLSLLRGVNTLFLVSGLIRCVRYIVEM